MTTVAYDGRLLAADTLADAGNLRCISHKIRHCGKFWYAGVGSMYACEVVARWLTRGAKFDDAPEFAESYARGIVIDKVSGEAFHINGSPVVLVQFGDKQQADGSGRDFAISAMAMGRDATAAVKFASQFDIATNDQVDTLVVKTGVLTLHNVFGVVVQSAKMTQRSRR